MKMTFNATETLKYILSYQDNPQNSDKKKLFKGEENKIRVSVLEKFSDFLAEGKKRLNDVVKEYNILLVDKKRELTNSKIRPELYEEKMREDEALKAKFEELQKVKEEVGKSEVEFELTDLEFAFCQKQVLDWDEKIGWEVEEAEVSDELLKLYA
jgi:hypothetical protein